ncbi:DinB family protein [Arthrobacter sp. H5]|uniref:DinB family protein n=1 Tax=Arthrobacter sp. H5 TaxID=1267973 RepID=UPI000480A51E|nr:DinB family protein [Arthrobacter sp. H5]
MPIEPDTKDWTWVLNESCGECGFSAGDFPATKVADRIREDLPHWEEALRRGTVAERPGPNTWSGLEYAAHVRDVFVLFTERTELMLGQDNPVFADWDQDQAARELNYAGQVPLVVARDLVDSGEKYAALLEATTAWDRTGRRSNGSQFTVATLAQYGLHDVVHHLHDVNG